MTLSPLGDSAVIISFGETVDSATAARVQAVSREIERHRPAGVVDVVPAFASIAVFFDAAHLPNRQALKADLEMLAARAEAAVVSLPVRTVEIPVCYDGEFAPDLTAVAAHTKLSPEEVVRLHAGGDYQVHAIGFAPGFPYLGGLPAELATPRRATPRPQVSAGSVGIGGAQTGIYPLETPGGWNLIGRTPVSLFEPDRAEPSLLRSGDRVKFRPISPKEFRAKSAEPVLSAERARHKQDLSGIEVLRPGLFTTIQDLGRRGHRSEGVPLSGATDPFALRLANALVGNPEDAAALELTLVGPELHFQHETIVALTGADFVAMPRWRPFKLAAGTRLNFGPARSGCRGYLAVAGGFDVAPILGSRSTYVRAQLGGFEGRALVAGDVLPVPTVHRVIRDHWRIDERILPRYSAHPIVRVLRGAHAGEFDPGWMQSVFKVSSRSDRMGARLVGPPVVRNVSRDLISSPVAPGTIQVPPDGQPIVLLADAQTIGGYPQLAHVVSVDLSLVAQLRPGDIVQFESITIDEAHELMVAQERVMALLREGLAHKLA
jgi:antagonist of KipI